MNSPNAGYNPYSNIVPMGQTVQYQMQPNPQQQNYVFQPVTYGPNPYQASGQSMFGGDYYNPYQNQQVPNYQQYGYQYTGMYGMPGQYGGNVFISPMIQQQKLNEQIKLEMMKWNYANADKQLDQEKLYQFISEKLNPTSSYEVMTKEERHSMDEWNYMVHLYNVCNSPNRVLAGQQEAAMINTMLYNGQKEFEGHSLCEFLNDDLWKLEREIWLEKNIDTKARRNIGSTYDSKEYTELLKLHNSDNPYISQLLDDGKFDNNLYDSALGMQSVYNAEAKRLSIIQGKLPTYISSEDTQRRRREWTNHIIDAIYKKNNGGASP